MMFTHDEMLSAVRTAGENGQTFTCGAVRDCLGVKSGDREKMNQFHRRFRTFQKEAAGQLEKVGKNAYRLRPFDAAPTTNAPVIAHVLEAEALEVAPHELMEVEPELLPAQTDAVLLPSTDLLPLAAATAALPPLPAANMAPSAPIESMEMPLRMIELDFDVARLPLQPSKQPVAPEPAFVERRRPAPRGWLDRGQWLGRRVAEFFGRA